MESPLALLETAIADVGYWRWWTSDLPEMMQLEFGGTKLCFPPAEPGQITSGLLAVRLRRPRVALFLSSESTDLPEDWPDAMARDEYEPFSLDRDHFTLTSHDDAAKYLADAFRVKPMIGAPSDLHACRSSALVAFWTGPVGFVGAAESIAFCNMHGEVDIASIPDWNDKWWRYWKEYWARKDTPNPMPHDYACEVTIPAGEE